VSWAVEARATYRELERNEAVQDAFGEGVVIVDAQGRVTACTRRAAALLGVRAEEVESRPVREALPGLPSGLEPHEVARGAVSTAGLDPTTVDVPRVIYVAQELAPSDTEAATEARHGMVVRLRGEARFAAQRKGQMLLLASLRHDVRSPLTALRGLVGVLQEEPDMPRDERLGLLELLRQEAERTVTWVEDYLVLLRLRFDSRPSTPAQLPASKPAQTIFDTFAKHAKERGIAFTVEVDPHAERHTISVDTTLLDPFCKNLVGHFLRLADSGAEVRVRSDASGRLVVEGRGPGLFAQHPPHPFTTLARSTASGKRTPGVGLGLFVVKKIADVHGWPLAVQVEDGVVSLAVDWAR
jgi:K+-sensing histidine kinase KdpD